MKIRELLGEELPEVIRAAHEYAQQEMTAILTPEEAESELATLEEAIQRGEAWIKQADNKELKEQARQKLIEAKQRARELLNIVHSVETEE